MTGAQWQCYKHIACFLICLMDIHAVHSLLSMCMLLHADSDLTARLYCSLAGHLWLVFVVHVTVLYLKTFSDFSWCSCSQSPPPILVDLRQTPQAGQQTRAPVIVWTGNLSLARTTQGRALPVTTTFRYILRSVAPFSIAVWPVRSHPYQFMPQPFL